MHLKFTIKVKSKIRIEGIENENHRFYTTGNL